MSTWTVCWVRIQVEEWGNLLVLILVPTFPARKSRQQTPVQNKYINNSVQQCKKKICFFQIWISTFYCYIKTKKQLNKTNRIHLNIFKSLRSVWWDGNEQTCHSAPAAITRPAFIAFWAAPPSLNNKNTIKIRGREDDMLGPPPKILSSPLSAFRKMRWKFKIELK